MKTSRTPLFLPEDEITSYSRVNARLTLPNSQPALIGENGEKILLPKSLHRLLIQILDDLTSGKAVSVVPVNQELTTHQAANFMGFSRPYLIKLLEEGAILYHRVGTHRRIYLNDLLRYRDKRDQERHQALLNLSKVVEEDGLYDKVYMPNDPDAE